MSMDASQPSARLRRVLTAVVVVDLISLFFFVGDARGRALTEGVTLASFADLLSRPFVCGIVVAVGVISAAVFGRRAGRLYAGGLALLTLALLNTVHAELFGSPWRHMYYSGLCLLGWLLGLVISRSQAGDADESYAAVGSTALLGAAYFNSGISKLVFGGMTWVSGMPIQAVVVAQDGMVADSFLSAYRTFVVTTPVINVFFSSATILLELAGPLLLGRRWMRTGVALGLVAMHLNILVLTHILYWQAMVFLVLFGLRRGEPAAETVAQPSRPGLLEGRPFAITTALLVVVALIGVGYQGRRFASWYGVDAGGPPRAATDVIAGVATNASNEAVVETRELQPDSVIPLQQFGPFTAGESLTDGWSIDAMELRSDGLVMMLASESERVRFEVTCAPLPHRSPLDLGPVHILFAKDAAFEDVADVGRALGERLGDATEGQVLCERLEGWAAVARAGR